MAVSGSMTTSSWSNSDGTTRNYTLSWSAKQDVATNTSTITWTLKSSGSYTGRVAERTLTAVINGTTVFSKTDRVMREPNTTVATGTLKIEHASDGSKSFSASVSAAVYTSSINCTKTTTFALDKIARQSAFGTITGSTLGSPITIKITRQVASFTHQFWYRLGGSEWYNLGGGFTDTITFTPDINLCSRLPNATSGTLELCIRTLNGSTQVGSDVYKNITANVPASIVPTVAVAVTDVLGHVAKYGSYIQGQSKIKAAVTAAGAYGSTIKSYSTTIDGKTYTSANVETGVLTGTGELTLKTTVTDSRGRTASASKKLTVTPYALPRITDMKVTRCDADGSGNSSGKYLAVKLSAEITSLSNKNSASYTIQYKKTDATVYTSKTLTDQAGKYSLKDVVVVFEADQASGYEVIFTATDAFSAATKGGTGSSITTFMSWLKKGMGLAIGKIATYENAVEIAFKTKFTGGFMPNKLATSIDLNTLMVPNIYHLSADRTYVNAPVSGVNATLEVHGDESTVMQRFSVFSKTKPKTYERTYDGTWGAWVKTPCLDDIYPVGAVYIAYNNATSPASLFGGTWTQLKGVFPYFNEGTATGGNTIHDHWQTVGLDYGAGTLYAANGATHTNSRVVTGRFCSYNYDGYNQNASTRQDLTYAGSSMPPYVTLYAWRRTA